MIPVLFIAKDRVNYKAIAIFILNNYIGPDSYWTFSFIPINGHTAFGFLFWAIPLTFFYVYLTRFSIRKENKWFRFIDEGVTEITWKNAYLLTIAGGFCHFFIDMVGHMELDFNLIQGSSLTLIDAQLWGAAYYHNYTALIIVGFAIQLVFIFFILYFLRQELKSLFKFISVMIGISLLCIFTLGGNTFGELEVSTLLLIGLYFILPLSICGYVFRDMHEHPVKINPKNPYRTCLSSIQKFRIASGIMIVFGLLLIVASIFAILESDVLGEIFDFDGDIIYNIAQIAIFVAIFLTIVAFGMGIWKINLCRKIIMGLCFCMAPIIFPLAIHFVLCENDVIELFTSNHRSFKSK